MSEWERQLGYEMPSVSSHKDPMKQEWIKVLYSSPNAQTFAEAKIGYIHRSQLRTAPNDY